MKAAAAIFLAATIFVAAVLLGWIHVAPDSRSPGAIELRMRGSAPAAAVRQGPERTHRAEVQQRVESRAVFGYRKAQP